METIDHGKKGDGWFVVWESGLKEIWSVCSVLYIRTRPLVRINMASHQSNLLFHDELIQNNNNNNNNNVCKIKGQEGDFINWWLIIMSPRQYACNHRGGRGHSKPE